MLYTGTFEAYQGLDLLFAAARGRGRRAPGRALRARWRPARAGRARAGAGARRGLGRAVVFAGQRPAEEIPGVSSTRPTCSSRRAARGTNTPLKIYQYLRSGRPIVATRLLTHTQVLDDDVSFLTPATPEGFAGGILARARPIARARARSRRTGASALAETKYSYEAYLSRTREACALPRCGSRTPQIAGDVV